MRWQLAAAVGLLALVCAWAVFQPRSRAPDLVVARDRLVAGDAVVATFSPGAAEGYRFTVVRGEGWVWERTSGPGGAALPDAIVFNGSGHLLRLGEGCFIPLGAVSPPLVPGLTVARRLTTMRGLDEQEGGRYAYDIDASAFGRDSLPAPSVTVREDLSGLRSDGSFRASTGQPPGAVWPGDYTVTRASPQQQGDASRLIREARASDYAELVIRERVAGTLVLSNAVLGPYRVVIAGDCPDRPTVLSSGVAGGQVEALRSAASPLRFGPGDPAVIERARETRLHIRAPVESFNDLAAEGGFGTVPVTSTSVILARMQGGGFLAVEIVACTARPWFRC